MYPSSVCAAAHHITSHRKVTANILRLISLADKLERLDWCPVRLFLTSVHLGLRSREVHPLSIHGSTPGPPLDKAEIWLDNKSQLVDRFTIINTGLKINPRTFRDRHGFP